MIELKLTVIQLAFKKTLRETKGQSLSDRIRYFRLSILLTQGQHNTLKILCNEYSKKGIIIGYYFLAHSYFLFGEFGSAKKNIDIFLSSQMKNDDAIYLAVDILKGLGFFDDAWELLTTQIKSSKRLKTWIVMSNLVVNEEGFLRMKRLSDEAIARGALLENNVVFERYLLFASLRAQRYKESEQMALDSFCLNRSRSLRFGNNKKNSFSPSSAKVALKNLKNILLKAEIVMFLVSGTLLGCIREKRILSHDNDLDVGVWESVNKKKLIRAIQSSGLFYIQTPRSPHSLRLRHVNGTPIDIFYHYIEGEEVWHGGVKVRWYNTMFQLTEWNFLGDVYLIPKGFDIYLTENYGNWKLPVKDFDSAIDTPNAKLENKYEMTIHILNQLSMCTSSVKVNKYMKLLKYYGVKESHLKQVSKIIN